MSSTLEPVPSEPEHRPISPPVAISNHMVRLLAARVGRGPTRARTTITHNLVVVAFGDTMTRAERNLVAGGETRIVLAMRRTLQEQMRREAVGCVEEIIGRRVIAYMGDLDTEADLAILAFMLEPDGAGPSVSIAGPQLSPGS